jgi:CRISPR-associated endoribonuclease Cas6
MIYRYTVSFDRPGKPDRGYALYAALLETLPPETAGLFHEQEGMTVSQYFIDGVWTVTLFGAYAEPAIDALLGKKTYKLDKYDTVMEVTDVRADPVVTEKTLARRYMLEEAPVRDITVRFITPASFKSGGAYINMPTVRLIFQSFMLKWARFAADYALDDSETLEHLAEHCRISRYALKSAVFPLKGVKIPAFTGYVTIKITGPEQLARLAGLLAAFGEYSGVGIKTTLGMGGCGVTR